VPGPTVRPPGSAAPWSSWPKTCVRGTLNKPQGLQLHAVQARPARSHVDIRLLIRTAVDALKSFINGLVMSRSVGHPGFGRA
jgi:hypothetical protein